MKHMAKRLQAAEQLLLRYKFMSNRKPLEKDVLIDAVAVIISKNTAWHQKRAAKILLVHEMGVVKANDIIEESAVVSDRSDGLVRRWRNKVVRRDGVCQECGSSKDLHAHHISHWKDDPINRINVENGITLCAECHSLEHEHIANLILSKRRAK